ncbi:ABC transporter substrate-binding protein [Candidatus Gracilibacteria bacterium]|nr:ABC transporter substrate-binding protein [Candidatus Gracilibacteria bacterium]
MNYHILHKFKKYLLLLSIILFFLTGSHLSYTYLTHDADFEAIPGGTISEAIVGSFPHFNPLLPSSDHNSYINGLLYRSLLNYDQESKRFTSDIASCNLEKLGSIECVLEENIRWSNGQNITADDIIATYDIIRQTGVHPLYSSLLENVSIRKNGNVISFTTGTRDINILSLFLQPILPKSIVDTLNSETVEGKLSDVNGVFSGMFTVSNIIIDETTGVSRITLERNNNYSQNPTYIEYLIINLFRDENHLLQNRSSSFNIKYDRNGIIANSIPRLQSHHFIVPQFTSLFYNTQNIDLQLRSHLNTLIKREGLVSGLGNTKVEAIYNPFFSERLIEKQQEDNFSFESYLNSRGYYSKNELLRQLDAKQKITQESELFADSEAQDTRPLQEELTIVRSPTTQKYNFVNSDNILIEGSVPAGVSAVYVNDYRLQGFSEGDRVFFYRLLGNFDSITDGENKYDIYFEINGERALQETFFYYLIEDEEELDDFRNNFFRQEGQSTPNQNTQLDDLLEIQISREEINNLPANRYYTPSGEVFRLKLTSVQTDILLTEALQIVRGKLEDNGIELEIESMSLGELTNALRNESVEYDMILLGIDVGYFSGNIFPYFHSSQVENGYNLSKFSKLGLDILLEELRSEILTRSEEEELQEKILSILEEEQLMKTLYSNKYKLLIDRNIRREELPKKFSNTQSRQFIFKDMYFNESQMIQWDNKSIVGGLRFIISKLF